MALVLPIPALCCQKVPGPYSSGTGVWVPSLYLFCGSAPLPSIGLNADALQSVQAKLTRAQNIRVICGMGEGRGGSHHAFCASRPRRSIWGPGMCASVAEKPFTSEVQQFFCRELLNGCTCWEFMKSASNKVWRSFLFPPMITTPPLKRGVKSLTPLCLPTLHPLNGHLCSYSRAVELLTGGHIRPNCQTWCPKRVRF